MNAGIAGRAEATLAQFDLPARPPVDFAEFEQRYAAAMRTVARYAAAVAAVAGEPEAHDRLVAIWPAVRVRVERLGRLCELAVTGGTGRRRRHHRRDGLGPSARRKTMHEVHRALVTLENVVDKAVAMAIAVVLAADEPDSAQRRAEVDDWVRALTVALQELEQQLEH